MAPAAASWRRMRRGAAPRLSRRSGSIRSVRDCGSRSFLLELRYDAAGEELERPRGLRVADAAEVDLHRGLEFPEHVPIVAELLDDVLGRADQRLAVLQHRLEGRRGDRLDHLAVARVLGRLVARPRGHGFAEDLDVPLDARARALDRLAMRLGHVAVQRALHLLGARRVAGFAPRLAIRADHVTHPGHAADIGDHHHVVTATPGPYERLDGGHRGDRDRRMRLLHRPWAQMDVAELVKLARI